jgi:hypothetical protein
MQNVRGATRFLVVSMLFGCGPKSTPTTAATSEPPPAPISLVTSFVVIDACPESKKLDTKLATREIEELVGPCKKVPGGAAHFSATLLPGGRVELAAPSGDVADGVVPTCLLQQQTQLKHKIRLSSACKFDVKLEQRLADHR